MSLNVVWFKRDLRWFDHAPLAEAARRGPVLPLYIAEPALWQQPDAAARQWCVFAESLAELTDALGALGQPLIIRVGDAIDVLDALLRSHGAYDLWSHQETGNGWTHARDRRVRAWSRIHGIRWTELPQHGIIRGLKDRDGWARHWDRLMSRPLIATPDALAPVDNVYLGEIPSPRRLGLDDDPCPHRQTGGRRAGLGLLASFLDYRGARYHREMSSPNTAYQACSRLSVHFATGTVSMREAAQAARRRVAALDALPPADRLSWQQALRAFQGRLHWHCHFMQKLEDQPSLEFENQHPAYDGLREHAFDDGRFRAWCAGQTGFPFIDACMRALIDSGWINFRMRAMLMAFASYHLWLHWRPTALHLARLFVDYEPGIHYPQAQMQSGTTGINTPRIYNPVKQSHDQDPAGTFIRAHLPELRGVPGSYLHEPWMMPADVQQRAACIIGTHYPYPIVDHLAAARDARARVWAVRRGAEYRATADAVQERHGSRRSGLPSSNPGRRRRGVRSDPAQASLRWVPEAD